MRPPRTPRLGDGRTYAFGSRLSSCMRDLSPRMDPPVTCELGSMVSTATFSPAFVSMPPSASISVLLPAPGGPAMPTRTGGFIAPARALSLRPDRATCSRSASACSRCVSLEDSTSVMARARACRSPDRSFVARLRVAELIATAILTSYVVEVACACVVASVGCYSQEHPQ